VDESHSAFIVIFGLFGAWHMVAVNYVVW